MKKPKTAKQRADEAWHRAGGAAWGTTMTRQQAFIAGFMAGRRSMHQQACAEYRQWEKEWNKVKERYSPTEKNKQGVF